MIFLLDNLKNHATNCIMYVILFAWNDFGMVVESMMYVEGLVGLHAKYSNALRNTFAVVALCL